MSDTAPIITAFLPCRKGSERVPRKNICPFGNYKHGLIEIKINQLLSCSNIDQVVVSTNDEEIIDFIDGLDPTKISLHHRSEHLSSSSTSTDELVCHARDLIKEGHILWTHVTSPFFGSELYSDVINSYFRALAEGYDSLMTTTTLYAFLWDEKGPINYDKSVEKWPRTQTLHPIHEVNSAVFLAPVEIYDTYKDRIGNNPLLYPVERLSAIDIDWREDFLIAEQLLLNGIVNT